MTSPRFPNPSPPAPPAPAGGVGLLVGVSRSTLYAMVQRGEFPPPVRIGVRAVAWRAHEVYSWVETRPSARAPMQGGTK